MKPLLLYTMTSGLGDYIIMANVMQKVEKLIPYAKSVIAHRRNPHVYLWKYDDPGERFFNVYSPKEFLKLISKIKNARKIGYTVFGLQMAPGSVQGFFFLLFLKKLKALDFIVDFNLINADIITPPKGEYILDLHLNQIKDLLRINIPKEFYNLELPIKLSPLVNKKNIIAIHPWSRRGDLPSFVWSFDKWLRVIRFLINKGQYEVVIFGKDKRFWKFRDFLRENLGYFFQKITFNYCSSVKDLVNNVRGSDLLISVNTSVVHIGYALGKKMIILCGPSLDIWIPKGKNILAIKDENALFPPSDKYISDKRFGSVKRISDEKVIEAVSKFLSNSHCDPDNR